MPLPRTFRRSGSRGWLRNAGRVVLRVEGLEVRAIPAAGPVDVFHATVSSGSQNASPADTPTDRIDPNVTSSPFGGVGSIQVNTRNSALVATGTAIGRRYVLTAAHIVDLNNDGKVNGKDGLTGVYFLVNLDGNVTYKIAVTDYNLHPDFSGFGHPAVNDDLAVLTLAEDLPADVPIYSIDSTPVEAGTVIKFVGYGRSGDGVRGYTTPASPTIKRVGENTIDGFYGQDDRGRPEANEVFRFDFDGPSGSGPLGGPSLGNDRESTIGPGDSGAPAFEDTEGGQKLVGIMTFTQGATAPKFGSMGGGILLSPYLSFIDSVMMSPSDPPHGYPPLPGVTPPLPIVGSAGGAGVGIGARALRAKMSQASFPPAQDRPTVTPPPPVVEPPLPTLPPVELPADPPADPVIPPTPGPDPLPPDPIAIDPIVLDPTDLSLRLTINGDKSGSVKKGT